MKKILSALFVASLSLTIGNLASADPVTTPGQVVNPGNLQVRPQGFKLMVTTIKGEITVPSTFSSGNYGNGPVALGQGGFGCSNIVVIANSKEMKPRPPGTTGFYIDQPVWTKSVNASGSYASGKCSYSMVVPGDQQFSLNAGTNGSFDCSVISLDFGNSTPQWQSVPKGTQKTDNLSLSKITCIVIG